MKKDYYDSIENLPIWNWWKITETGELVYLYKNIDKAKEDFTLLEIWTNIHNEYLVSYGLTEDFKSVLKLKKKWIEKQAAFIESGDRFKLTEIDIINAQIAESINTENSMSKEDIIIFLEEKLGREIDTKVLTVKKYLDYINYYSKKK